MLGLLAGTEHPQELLMSMQDEHLLEGLAPGQDQAQTQCNMEKYCHMTLFMQQVVSI